MKLEIMIGILFMLLSRKRVTAKEISEKYGVSKRSVYRYIDEISLIVPVYATTGPKGGYSLMDNFRLPATFLTEDEYTTVLQALEAFRKELPGDAISSAIDKIRANSKTARDSFNLKTSSLVIDSGPWGITSNYNNTLHVLEECVANQTVAEISYRDTEGKQTSRQVEPHTLVLKQGIWYIYAFCRMRCEFRLFKIGRIESVKVLDLGFERKNADSLANVFSYWANVPETAEVAFEADESILTEIEEWLGVDCVERADRGILVRATLPVNSGLTSKLLGYGGKIRVLAPQSLTRLMSETAREILRQYEA